MGKICLFGLLVGFVSLIFPQNVWAQEAFASTYSVSYVVSELGETAVTENITFRNLTDKYYASSFTLMVGATDLYDVSASDTQGPLETQVQSEATRSQVVVKFRQQVVGFDKNYKWQFRFKSKDFAQIQGQVKQISIPRAPKLSANDDFSLSLAVPVAFGEPTVMTPEAVHKSEAGGQILFNFNKEQIQRTGVLAIFGSEQKYNFELNYTISNNSFLPTIASIPIPPDTSFQEVLIDSISPKPENVIVDADGNYLAYFKVDKRQRMAVVVKGQVNLRLKATGRISELSEASLAKYTQAQKYWDVSSPLMKGRLAEIFKDVQQNTLSNSQKAKLIHQFVVGYLKFDDKRLASQNFSRLGALTVLNNPDQALSSEFTDLFVTLARSAGMPARRLEGLALTTNSQIRPLSLFGKSMHAWPEYYDSQKGWVMIDPTWENTNGGVDYFSRFDLNHMVVAILGQSSITPSTSYQGGLSLTGASSNINQKVSLNISSANELIAGFPINLLSTVENIGNVAVGPAKLKIEPGDLILTNSQGVVETPILPPYGRLKVDSHLLTKNIWSFQQSDVEVNFMNQTSRKRLVARPFYEYSVFLVGVVSLVLVVVSLYVLSLILHIKRSRQ